MAAYKVDLFINPTQEYRNGYSSFLGERNTALEAWNNLEKKVQPTQEVFDGGDAAMRKFYKERVGQLKQDAFKKYYTNIAAYFLHSDAPNFVQSTGASPCQRSSRRRMFWKWLTSGSFQLAGCFGGDSRINLYTTTRTFWWTQLSEERCPYGPEPGSVWTQADLSSDHARRWRILRGMGRAEGHQGIRRIFQELPVSNERWTPSSVRMERQQTVSNWPYSIARRYVRRLVPVHGRDKLYPLHARERAQALSGHWKGGKAWCMRGRWYRPLCDDVTKGHVRVWHRFGRRGKQALLILEGRPAGWGGGQGRVAGRVGCEQGGEGQGGMAGRVVGGRWIFRLKNVLEWT